MVIGCTGDVLNTGARKFDPESADARSGCACVVGVADGTADMFCVTCSAAPPLKVHDASQSEEEWRTLKESGYVVSGRAQATDVVLALLTRILPPWAAPGRQKLVRFTSIQAPKGVLGNKNRFPCAGGWIMDLPAEGKRFLLPSTPLGAWLPVNLPQRGTRIGLSQVGV